MNRFRFLKKISLFLTVIILLNGCRLVGSVRENGEVALYQTSDTYVMPEEDPEAVGDDRVIYSFEEEIASLKDTVPGDDKTEYIYTVHNARYYEHISESDIDMSSYIAADMFVSDHPGVIYEDEVDEFGVVISEVTVENVQGDEDFNVTGIQLVTVSEKTGRYDDTSLPCYFSATANPKEAGAWHCDIKKGEKRTFEVGWLVDMDEFDLSSLYLHVLYSEGKFVDLNLQDGEI